MHACLPSGTASASILAVQLQYLLIKQNRLTGPPVIICIGTDRIIGDSLGPLVGTGLQKAGIMPYVYGSLEAPVHALNLSETLETIKQKHPDNTLIAVDASLGSLSHIGFVTVRSGGLHPGAGVNKTLHPTGDISITGITNLEDGYPWLALQTARLSTVISMADCIVECIHTAVSQVPFRNF